LFGNPQTFSALKNPAYRLYYGSVVGQTVAMSMQLMARSLLMYRLTGSVALIGVLSLAGAIPEILLSLYGGVLADRFSKKRIMVLGQAGYALTALAVALALSFGIMSADRPGSWIILVIIAALRGVLMGLVTPSRQAVIPEIVGNDQVMNAIALSNMARNALRLASPVIGGFLIEAVGFQANYYVMAGMYGLSMVLTMFLPAGRMVTAKTPSGSAVRQLTEGFRYILRESTLGFILIFTLVFSMLSMPYSNLLPVFADDILKIGASGLGILISTSAIGATIGSFILASLPNRSRGKLLLADGVILGTALAVFAFSSNWYLSLFVLLFVGFGQTTRLTVSNALVQNYSAEEYRGRVMSVYLMESGVTSLGTFAAALLADWVGVQWAIGSLGAVLVLYALLSYGLLPRIRQLQ
jgi:MFS family permease